MAFSISSEHGKLAWDELQARLWVAAHPANMEGQLSKSSYVAMLPLSLLRSGSLDAALLPGKSEPIREYADFAKNLLELGDDNFSWTEAPTQYLLDDAETVGAVSDLCHARAATDDGVLYTVVPRYATKAILENAKENQYTVLGDLVPGLKASSTAILHRDMAKPDEPSLVEAIDASWVTPFGFTCSKTEHLLAAYPKIKEHLAAAGRPDAGIELLPVRQGWAGAARIASVSSQNELELYDFALGPVVMREVLDYDRDEDGLIRTAACWLSRKQLGLVDELVVAETWHRSRDCRRPQEFQDEINAITKRLLAETKLDASGACKIVFMSLNGKPVLYRVASGFANAHYALLFKDAYAQKSNFVCWSTTPDETLDVWTLWARLANERVAFRPRRKRKIGVYPLSFTKGLPSVLIAVTDGTVDLDSVVAKAEAFVTDPVSEDTLELATMDTEARRIWVNSARVEYRRITQRYNLPNRCLTLVRPGKDFIVLPGGHEPTRDWAEWVAKERGLDDDQIIFTSGEQFVLDDDMDNETVAKIKSIVATNSKDKFVLFPYCVTPQFERWANQLSELGVAVLGERVEWVEKFGSKGILHRHIQSLDTQSVLDEIAPGIPVAKGYGCSTVEDLLKAYELIGAQEVVIKPVFGAAGEGIKFISQADDLKHYTFPMGDVCLEEKLQLDTVDGIVLSPAVHYMKSTLVGNDLVDQIMVGTGYMGWRRSRAEKAFQKQVERTTKLLIKATNPSGPGGFDFLSVDGEPLLSDINTGRFNGAHFAKLFREQYAPELDFFCWKKKPSPNLTVDQFFKRIQSAGLAFDFSQPEKGGVFPLQFLRGLSGMYVALAKTQAECEAMYERAKSTLKDRVTLEETLQMRASSAEIVPEPAAPVAKMTLIKNADHIYDPELITQRHILLGGGEIVALLDDAAVEAMEPHFSSMGVGVVDATGCIVVPGFVDAHEHFAGGGGEAGPSSRTPEAKIEELVEGGVTTAIGVTGTDSIGRTLDTLLTKCRALAEDGISTYMWTGAYRLPLPTITGSVARDIMLVERVVGAGEVAVSDHRGSRPSVEDLIRLGSECRVGGMLGGKAGVVHVHVGDGPGRLEPLFKAVRESDVPAQTFYPTHISGRSLELIDDGARWISEGGYVDLTAASARTTQTLAKYFAMGVDLNHVTVSSDAYGSCPTYGPDRRLQAYSMHKPTALLTLFHKLFFELQWPPERILPLFTRTPAEYLKLEKKGKVQVGAHGDLVLLDTKSLEIKYVYAQGIALKTPTFVTKGKFGGFANC
eukprot:m.90543 g.90543  ORF g.90543 m.90543 type:complete len:1273 (-) comp15010_c0_seq4:98-3916(-)